MNFNLNNLLNSIQIPFFDNGNVLHSAVAVIILGILILAITFIVPILGGIVLLLGIILIAFVVYRYFNLSGK